MKKTGIILSSVSLLAAILLFLLRKTAWFAAQKAQTMSEFGELADSAFWAALITLILGLVLLVIGLRRGSADDAKKSPKPLTEHWVCPHCGGKNTQLDRTCQTCGLDRPLTMPPWKCDWCGTENESSARVCSNCGRSRPTAQHTWSCDWCGTENPGLSRTCSVCGRPRGGGAPSWSCTWCGTENQGNRETCSLCGRPNTEHAWTCPDCGARNPARQRTCTNCQGRPNSRADASPRPAVSPRFCPSCGAGLEAWDKVCPGCGSIVNR